MKGQELKILFKENMAFLTKEVALDFTQLNLPDSTVKFNAPAFWTIRVLNYIENENRLFVEVLSYHVGETDFSNSQIGLADVLNSIETVTFRSIDTSGLLRTLKSKEPVKVLPPKQEIVYRREPSLHTETIVPKEPVKRTYNEPFSVAIKDIEFLSGKVKFAKKIKQLNKLIEFEIVNENIIEQYDAVKDYFAIVLKTKKIQVIPVITTVDGVITSINATSNEIDQIDSDLIEEFKFELVKGARKKEVLDDKQVFTIQEYVEAFLDEGINAEQLFNDDEGFFDIILKQSKTKHYNQLRYLSSKQNFDLQKLCIVHKPLSFVFLVSNIDSFHIIWETLDTTEATYVWTFANDESKLNEILKETNETINMIIKSRKIDYIKQKIGNFNRVYHDYTNLEIGFKIWKAEIDKIIL